MKLLTLSIPNHHFFQWINQLEDSDIEVYWMDVTDSGYSPRIPWVNQITGWRLKKDYPGRMFLKRHAQRLYSFLNKYNERSAEEKLQSIISKLQPDLIHCFEMRLSGVPFQKVWDSVNTPVIYSSWGSDVYDFKNLGLSQSEVTTFLKRVDFLITDCKRDYSLAQELGFSGNFLGVLPGNGGINLPLENSLAIEERSLIMIKGYDDGVGQARVALQALELVNKELIADYKIFIYSADEVVLRYVDKSPLFQTVSNTLIKRGDFIPNDQLLKKMGRALLHIGLSTSDGMPNSLLEAMGMGAFPIQSNPGGSTQEVIEHNKNGFIIHDPKNVEEVKKAIEIALKKTNLIQKARDFNTRYIDTYYNRGKLRASIQEIYSSIYNQ